MRLQGTATRTRSVRESIPAKRCLLRGFEGRCCRDLDKRLALLELSGVVQHVGSEFEKLVAAGLPSLGTLDADEFIKRGLYAREDSRFHRPSVTQRG
jgi:hypothetical protein